MQPGLGVKVLARETQVVLHRAELNLGPAKGQGSGLPDHCALSCNQPLRRAQVIVDVVVQARPEFVFPKRQGLLPQPGIFPEYGAVPGNLRYQPILQIIQIVRGLRAHALANTTVLAVIAVAGYLLTVPPDCFQTAERIPTEAAYPVREQAQAASYV